MRSAVNRARKSESGFTLIELLIVIVILGILAAIVVFSVRGITDRGTQSACKANVATINTAVEAYYAKLGKYPSSDDDLDGVTDANNKFINPPVPTGIITYPNPVNTATAPTVKDAATC